MKRVLIITGLLLAGAAGFVAMNWYGDLPPELLALKYTSPDSAFIEFAGADLHYQDSGPEEAPALVLVHGNSASLHDLAPWVSRLDGDFRILAMDLPGHGLTGPVPGHNADAAAMGEAVLAVMEAAGVDRAVLAGHSMGGEIAWQLALAHPERVSHLVLIAASGSPSAETPALPLVFRLAEVPGISDLLTKVTPKWLIRGGLEGAYGDDNLVTEGMVLRYHDLARRDGNREAALQRMTAGRNGAVAADLARIPMPTLILWGAEDSFVPVAGAQGFAGQIPGATVQIFDGVGHMVMDEVPDASTAALERFLAVHPDGVPAGTFDEAS